MMQIGMSLPGLGRGNCKQHRAVRIPGVTTHATLQGISECLGTKTFTPWHFPKIQAHG